METSASQNRELSENLRRQVEQVNMIDFSNRDVGVDQIMMLNLKLREDLTQCFQNYLRVMTAADILNKENTQLKLRVERAKNDDNGKLYGLQSRVQTLEGQVGDRDAQLIKIEKSYEARVETLKSQLQETQRQNNVLTEQVSELQRLYFKDNKNAGGDTSQLQQLLNEKAQALVLVEQSQYQKQMLELELANFKTKMRLEQTELSAKMAGKPSHFHGNPKEFNEIVRISSQLDLMTVQNKERFIGLKELCIYANAGPQAVHQLQSLYPAKQAATSLGASDEQVIKAGLFLAEKVIKDSPNQAAIFLQNDGGAFSLQLLASANESIRVEALKVFPHLATMQLQPKLVNELLVRMAVLLDESLQAQTFVNKQQALICLDVVTNWLTANNTSDMPKKTESLFNFGIIKLAIRHLENPSLQVKQRSLHFLVQAKLSAFHVEEIFFDESLLKTLLQLMLDKEYSLQRGATEFFRNLSQFFSDVKLAKVAQKLDSRQIYSSLISLDQSDDIFALNLESLYNLFKSHETAYVELDFVRRGLIVDYLNPLLERNFQTLQGESQSYISSIFRLLAESPQVSGLVTQQLQVNRLTDMLMQTGRVDVKRNLFATFTQMMRNSAQKEKITVHAALIIGEASRLLTAKTDVNMKTEPVIMLAQFTDSIKYMEIFGTFSCEKLLIAILQDANARSNVKKAALRALIVLYSVGVLYGYQAMTSIYALREPEGIETMFTLLREAIEGTLRDEENQQLDWQMMILALKLVYVVCFNEQAMRKILNDENISILRRIGERSGQEKQTSLIFVWFRLLSFFSKYQGVQNQLLSLPLIKVIFSSLQSGSATDKKFILSVLYDFVYNTKTHEIIRSLSWTQGIEVLLNTCLASEAMIVSKIFKMLGKDDQIYHQMNNMMSTEYLHEVNNLEQGRSTFWADTHVPYHLKGVLVDEDQDIMVGNLKLVLPQQHTLLVQLLQMNYKVGSSDAEVRLYPELPSASEAGLTADSPAQGQNQQSQSVAQQQQSQVQSIRPESHRGIDKLPKVTSLKDIKKVNLTTNNLQLLRTNEKNRAISQAQYELKQQQQPVLDAAARKENNYPATGNQFVNSYFNQIRNNRGGEENGRSSSVPHIRGGGLPPTGGRGYLDSLPYGAGAEVTPDDSKSRIRKNDHNLIKVIQNQGAVKGGTINANADNTITIRKDQIKMTGRQKHGEPGTDDFQKLRQATVANQYAGIQRQ